MTKEIRFVIENHKFESSWTEGFTFILSVICLIFGVIIGLSSLISLEDWPGKITGSLITAMAIYGIVNLIRRFPSLNKFIVIETGKKQTDNYQFATKLLKEIDAKQIDHDFHNFCISAKVFSYPEFVPKKLSQSGFPSWITIISLDNKLLVNERSDIIRLALLTNYSLARFTKLIDKDKDASR